MKNNQLSYATLYPGLDALIDTGHAEISEEAKKHGKEYGMDNLPNMNDPSLDPIAGFIPSKYKTLNAKAQQMLNPDMKQREMKADTAVFEEQQTAIKKEIHELTHQNKIAERECGDVSPAAEKPGWKQWLLPVGFFSGEFLFTAKIFEYMGDDLLTSFGIALLLTICSYFAARYSVIFLVQGKTGGLKKYLLAVLCIAFGISLSIVLSIWRAKVIAAGNPDAAMSPVEFAVINLVIFLVSILITYKYMSEQSAQVSDKTLQAKHAAIHKRAQQIKAKEEELKALEESHQEKNLHLQEVISMAEHTTRRINALYLETMETFKSSLIAHRSDRQIPKCLYHPTPDLFLQSENKR